MKIRGRYLIGAAFASVASMFGVAYVVDTTPPKPPVPIPEIVYGDEVRVRLYRGLTGRLLDRATDTFGLEAHKKCGVRYYVESQAGMDSAALRSATVRNAKKVIFVGTSMGGKKARDMAEAFAPKQVRLLMVDPVPWTGPIPKNVGSDHVVWRNTWPFQLGGGRPDGTINDSQHDRPMGATHIGLIHSSKVRDEVVEEICRGVTHPSKRPSK